MESNSFNYRLTPTFWTAFQKAVDANFADIPPEQLKKLKSSFSRLLESDFKLDADNQVSKLSLKKIVNSFKNEMEERILSLDMLELTLRVIKTELGISSPTIPVFTVLNRDKPVLSPDKLVKAGLANELYSLCEQEQISPSVGIAPEFVLGRLALWLMLKEGVLDKKMLLAMLDKEREGWLRYNECIYFQYREQRILIGKATELFLIQYWFMQQGSSFKTETYIKNINAFLVYKEILNEGKKLTYSTLKLAFRIETTFNYNPIFSTGELKQCASYFT
jgi:hypothetical protein